MRLTEIIDLNKEFKEFNLKNNAHESLIRKYEDVFYVEPQYQLIHELNNARFVIFSAPGASGKSTLAEFIAYKTKSLYWNLAKIKLGENSLSGTLWEALDDNKMESFFNSLKDGTALFILDAFDEAEIISGQSGIKFLINDLIKFTEGGNETTVLMFARTESARFLVDYLERKNIAYCHYEIGFFDLENAKRFIQLKYERTGRSTNKTIKDCIEEQFNKIKELLLNDDNLITSFLGYAPVLEALSKALDDKNNTMKLLASLRANPNMTTNIVSTILHDLLEREQKKLNDALKQWLKIKYPDFIYDDSLYSAEEQCVRLLEFIMNGKFEENSFFEIPELPPEVEAEYIEKLKSFLRNHPFLQNTLSANKCNFTGPAFRDYVLAKIFVNDLYCELAYSYPTQLIIETHFPSQMLFDFYIETTNKISGRLFPHMYEAFKAKESNENTAFIKIESDEEDANRPLLQFLLLPRHGNDGLKWTTQLDGNEALLLRRLSNATVNLDKEIIIGENSVETKISNTVLEARKITLRATEIILEAKAPSMTFIASDENVHYIAEQIPQFKILTDDTKLIGVSFPNINDYYSLRNYRVDDRSISNENEYRNFKFFICRIMQKMRKHKKDTMAKDMEYIENRIVASNSERVKYRNFLLERGIMFVDSEESHLYKLNIEKLSEYGINWACTNNLDDNKFKKLYDDFCKRQNG